MDDQPPPSAETPLQRKLLQAVVRHVRETGMQPGEPFNQLAMAEQLGVSRTPLRVVVERLVQAGFLRAGAQGVMVGDPSLPLQIDAGDDTDPVEALMAAIARDRHEGRMPTEVSENDLMRRYAAARPQLVAALRKMAEMDLAERKPGFGWRFVGEFDTPEMRRESYRFRLLIEPMALLEPGYAADAGWIRHSIAQHQGFLERVRRPEHAVAFFEMNAEFHRQIVAFSGNRFLLRAIEQQNQLRRLRNWSWDLLDARVDVSCQDHLAVLHALAQDDLPAASALLRQHIEMTMKDVN